MVHRMLYHVPIEAYGILNRSSLHHLQTAASFSQLCSDRSSCSYDDSSLLWLLMLHIKGRLPVLLCAVKTVEGDFRFCWTTTPNVGQTHKENPNLVRILYMVCTLNDIYKQYNKLHEH